MDFNPFGSFSQKIGGKHRETQRVPSEDGTLETADSANSRYRPPTRGWVKPLGDFWLVSCYTLQFWRFLSFIGVLGLIGAALAPATALLFAAAVQTFLATVLPGSPASELGAGGGASASV